MAGRVYFDTDSFRGIADTFASRELRPDLRDRIALSPVTIMEVLSQLTIKSANEILKRIHALSNIVNRERALLLPWIDAAIAKIGFGVKVQDDTAERFGRALNACLQTENVDELRESACTLKDLLDRAKDQATDNFQRILEPYRKKPLSDDELRTAFVTCLAGRVGVRPDAKPVNKVIAAMSAYFEFEEAKLKEATSNLEYKPEKHKNDILDAAQLVYLEDAQLHFLTCDRGYSRRVQNSPQKAHIHTVGVDALKNSPCVEALIELMTS